MRTTLAIAGGICLTLAAPAMAQPASGRADADAQLSSEQLEAREREFAWLLGTWKAEHMFGPQSGRGGAQVTFFLESDGTVSARLDTMSPWMESSEKRFTDLVGRRFIRGIDASGAPRHVWSSSASGGTVFNKNTGEWVNLGIIYVSRDTGRLSHLGAMSDFAEWVKVSGSAGATPQPDDPNAPSASGRAEAGQASRSPQSDKKCNYSMYAILASGAMDSVIAQFEDDVDGVATYDSDMPIRRMFPNPINSAANIPVRYMDLADYRTLTRMEEVSADLLERSGPDGELVGAEREIKRLFKEARQSFDLSARIAGDRGKPCPSFSDPDAYPNILKADELAKNLRLRRDTQLKGRLAAGERLNEKLMRAFYNDLADASSLDERQNRFLSELREKTKQAIISRLTGESIEKDKAERLVPQLEILQERYSRVKAQGGEVSQETRDKDLKDALQKSGISYDPAIARSAKRDGQVSMGKTGFSYLTSVMGPKATGLGQHISTVESYFKAAKVTADTLLAMRNFHLLFGTEEDLMPVALAVQENRAHLSGLIERYDIFEQEYSIMRAKFENAVTEGGALSETN